jgi:diacylglycerol kinase (ATP)
MDDTLFFINPTANTNRALKDWDKLQRKYPILPEHPINILEIPDLAAYIKIHKPKRIVVAGGDGTINKVSYAMLPLQEKPVVGILPMGFGNAMAYSLGIDTIDHAMHVIISGKEKVTVDLLKTNIPEYPIGIFNISVGFDARVVHHRMHDRYIGFRSYFLSALKSLFFHNENKMLFTIDHLVQIHATASSLVIANSPVIGLNFVIADYARLNDSYLDCTLFSTKVAYITNMRLHGFKHPLYSNKGKVQFKAKHIRVEGDPFIQVDGDPAVLKRPLEVEILPSKITFLANDIQNMKLSYTPFVVKE